MESEFYLTLPSNSSMQYYPGNTTTKYSTHLTQQIRLSGGAWEVALAEFHYPCTYTMIGGDCIIYVYAYKEPANDTTIVSETAPIAEALTSEASLDEEELPPTSEALKGAEPQIVETVLPTQVGTTTKLNHAGSTPGIKRKKVPKRRPTELKAVKVEGYYTNVKEFITMLDEHTTLSNYTSFNYNDEKDRVSIMTTTDVIQVKLTPQLLAQLGFSPSEFDLKKNGEGVRPPDLRLGLPSQMYVYCDIIQPQMVGDVMAPLLRIVNIDNTSHVFGTQRACVFNTPHYVPVMVTTFGNVEIDIRLDTGKPVPFVFGTSCVKLHFRRRSDGS